MKDIINHDILNTIVRLNGYHLADITYGKAIRLFLGYYNYKACLTSVSFREYEYTLNHAELPQIKLKSYIYFNKYLKQAEDLTIWINAEYYAMPEFFDWCNENLPRNN